MTDWNAAYTQLVRGSRRGHWGNWGLNPQIKPGAVGIVSPSTGEFQLVDNIPGAQIQSNPISARWQMNSEHVSRQQGSVTLDGSAVDPDTGTKITVGLEIKWGLDRAGSMVSEFSTVSEDSVVDFGNLCAQQWAWLADKARSVGMGNNGDVSQGFGVITSVIFANSGLNVAAQSDNTTFSIAGSVAGVNDLVGQAKGSASYASTNSDKSVDQHIWPDQPNVAAKGNVPIAYTFASFAGRLIIPNWVSEIGSLQLVLNNQHGGTYIVDATLQYDVAGQHQQQGATTSGGLISTIGAIPLGATNLVLSLSFKGVFSDEHKSMQWATPLAEWISGTRHIDLYGVWPGSTTAVDSDAQLQV